MIAAFTLLSPLHHGAFSEFDHGNTSPLRRIPLAYEGVVTAIPAVSGNAVRGCTRRILARHLLDTTDTTPATIGREGYQRLYAALANGGHLEGAEAAVDPVQRRALRDALPVLSLLGAALYTSLLPGQVEFGSAWLRCAETRTAGLVRAVPWAVPMAEDCVADYSHVRHVDRDHHDPAVSGVGPMPTMMETIIAGSTLESFIIERRASELERSALAFGVSRVTTLGGKSSAGLGRVAVEMEGAADPAIYVDWLSANLDNSRVALADLAAKMTAKKEKKPKEKKEDSA